MELSKCATHPSTAKSTHAIDDNMKLFNQLIYCFLFHAKILWWICSGSTLPNNGLISADYWRSRFLIYFYLIPSIGNLSDMTKYSFPYVPVNPFLCTVISRISWLENLGLFYFNPISRILFSNYTDPSSGGFLVPTEPHLSQPAQYNINFLFLIN